MDRKGMRCSGLGVYPRRTSVCFRFMYRILDLSEIVVKGPVELLYAYTI